jgi:Na+/glutamate symporter
MKQLIEKIKNIFLVILMILVVGFIIFWFLYFFPAIGGAWNAAELY